ncbi:ubiquitin-like protein Pup [Candidatus Nitrospira salsa]
MQELVDLNFVGGMIMEKKERQQDNRKTDSPQEADETKANPKVVETGEKLKEEMDELVDEIDQVLEENAAEFVKNYVQKGGE